MLADRESKQVRVQAVEIPAGRRQPETSRVRKLAESIAEIGLLNPITVTEDGRLVAGLHRLLAARELGWEEIEARTVADVDAELAEIDENLIRAPLTELEKSRLMARRKGLFEDRHPESTAGAIRARAANEAMGRVVGETVSPTTFAQDTAEKTGVSERSVQHAVQIGRSITPETAAVIAGTPVEDHKRGLIALGIE